MTTEKLSETLKDVVAFVDVWSSSKTENYSKPFIQQLREMGAEVSKTFDKQVTHVVFKNGHQSTWNKAKKMGVKLVSVLWVARCKDCGEHIDEDSYPAINDESHRNPAFTKRTHRCMQPRDIPEQNPENNKSMKRKLDRMMKSLTMSSPSSPDLSPFLIDEASGIVYSPASKRASAMALRLKVMKEKRESLSRTDASDEDDSSDLDVSFSDLRSSFTDSRSNIEINRSATELPPRTDTKKQASVNRQAKKKTVKRPCPQGLHSESKGTKTQEHSSSSVQSNALECQTSLKSPAALFGEGAITPSPAGLSLSDSRDIRKRRKSSFKCDRAENANSQTPCTAALSGESRPPVEMRHVLNTEGNDPCGQTKASKVHSLSRDCSRSVSLPVSVTDSLVRKAAVARRRDRHHTEQASPLEAFCRRKSAFLAPGVRGSPASPRVSTLTDDGAFENYFSPSNRAEDGGRQHPLLSSLPWEPSPLPPIEEESKLRKRKRGMSETGSPGPARGKRRVSLLNGI